MDTSVDVFTQSLQQLLPQVLNFLPNLIASLVIFFTSLFLAGFVYKGVKKTLLSRDVDLEISIAVGTIARWTVLILGTTAALNQIGFDLTAFLAGLGIVGFQYWRVLSSVFQAANLHEINQLQSNRRSLPYRRRSFRRAGDDTRVF